MQRITPNLWFDNQAEEAARLYTGLFKNAKTGRTTRYTKAGQEFHGRDEGAVMTLEFELDGQSFVALNGGPHYKINPSISFFVTTDDEAYVDGLWHGLAEGGTVLMPLDRYDFSDKYGFVQDRFGVSWQLTLGDIAGARGQSIVPYLMFVNEHHEQAEAAMRHYTAIFGGAIGDILRYGPDQSPDQEGTVFHARFTLDGQVFMAMDSALEHDFSFNEAVSFIVNCESQEQVDYYWDKLGEGGEEGPCGWLKDKFGVSWQVVPTALNDMLTDSDTAKVARVSQAIFGMKKLDIAALEQAYAQG
jgi:predicted 3-demethylubiquinone-9 3-methyltransferase (glyoxalase superfamily)